MLLAMKKSDIISEIKNLSLFVACLEHKVKDMHRELINIADSLKKIISSTIKKEEE